MTTLVICPLQPAAEEPERSIHGGRTMRVNTTLNPRAIDFQLLYAFDALMTELHVTRAAQAIGVSQPAMSHMLNRLRDQFGDPLLVRTSHGMTPTARASELIEPIRDVLRQAYRIASQHRDFDPASSRESFNIRMGDMNEFLILPRFLQELERRAPGISIVVQHLSPSETVRALESGDLDFAVSTRLSHSKSIRSHELMRDKMVYVMRKDHPRAGAPAALESYLDLRHIRIAQDSGDSRFLCYEGPGREPLCIPHWLAAPYILECTDFVTMLSERMVRAINVNGRLLARPIASAALEFSWNLYWHRRFDVMPSHVWIRALLREVCAGLDDAAPPASAPLKARGKARRA
jgi:DNA-binding transcriptional LysR family regulator